MKPGGIEALAATYIGSRDALLYEVISEANAAQEKYRDFASMHEAYGVLAEEVAELFDAVRMTQGIRGRQEQIRAEAIQIAAVALRIAEQAERVTR